VGVKVQLHRRAETDLDGIKSYLLEHTSPVVAEKVRTHLRERIVRLAQNPNLGIATSHPQIRILSPGRYPYRIYFTRTPDAVVILHIRHTARWAVDVAKLI
jgi:toxin ParE1/3/4